MKTAGAALSKAQARRMWLGAQRLDVPAPFGDGPEAVRRAVEHLGYVQIDTINVVERCHHHILWTRIPAYRRQDLQQAQSVDKSVFEYWTHALSYVPTRDIRFFLPEMRRLRQAPKGWFAAVKSEDLNRVLALIRRDGALTIRDIDDDVLVAKDHAWASRKPSKRALQRAFFAGLLAVSARSGMLKTYELMERHFGWAERPRPATERQVTGYLLDRALLSQGVVSLDSACHLDAGRKPAMRQAIDTRVRQRRLVPVSIEGAERVEHWAEPAALETGREAIGDIAHILSPFDPLVIQRRRLALFFDYEHRFEAYLPKEKRLFGYFTLPVLVGDRIVAALDLKADRQRGALLVQQWTWIGEERAASLKARVEEELHRFESFQMADIASPRTDARRRLSPSGKIDT